MLCHAYFCRHVWEDKAAEMLRVIQLNTLEDRSVHDKYQWDAAIKFLEHSLQEKVTANELNLREQVKKYFYLRYSKRPKTSENGKMWETKRFECLSWDVRLRNFCPKTKQIALA